MTREELNTFIIEQAIEYTADARAWQERNDHMHNATPEQLAGVSDYGISKVVDGFRDHLVQSAGPDSPFAGFPTLEPKEVFYALVTGFANFMVGKQCLDLGLYSRDLFDG